MRMNWMFLRYVAGLAAFTVLSVASALAQFQTSTPDELKMTADPKYPDAGAIVLNYETKTDNKINYMSEYARIKILKESAKDLATIDLGYFKGASSIAAIQGRTIHADGTIVPLTVKPEDLLFEKAGGAEIHRKVLSMAGVEVGSIIEYYYQVRLEEGWLSRPTWEIQKRYPVRKERFFFQPRDGYLGSSLLWYTNLPNGQKLQPDAAGRFEINMTDVPPVSEEKWSPPIDARKYKVEFYFSTAMSSQQFWQSASKGWLKDVDTFAAPTGTLKQAAASLISPGDSELDRAKKIYVVGTRAWACCW